MDAVETQLADLRAAADEDRAGRAKAAHASREEVAHGRAQPAKRDAEDRASRARDDAARGGSARSSGDEVFFARGDSARSSRDGAARGDSARSSRDGAARSDSARSRDRAPSSVDDRSVVCLEDDASAAPKRAPPAAAPTMAPAAPPTPAPATACDEAAIVEAHNAPLSVGDARRLKWFGAVEFQVNAVGVSLTAKAGRLRVVEACVAASCDGPPRSTDVPLQARLGGDWHRAGRRHLLRGGAARPGGPAARGAAALGGAEARRCDDYFCVRA